jgi:hypothetical protein
MSNFCIFATDQANAERYWVRAESDEQARHLVALNVGGAAAGAEDASKFTCVEDTTKTPPPSFIYCSAHGPVAVEKR